MATVPPSGLTAEEGLKGLVVSGQVVEWRPHKVSKHSRRQRLCFVWRPKQLILCLENKPGIRWKRQRMQQLHAHAKGGQRSNSTDFLYRDKLALPLTIT